MNEIILLLLSIVNISIISFMVYKKKYGVAWLLAFLQILILLIK